MLHKTFSEYLRDQQSKKLQHEMIAHLITANLKHHAACLRVSAAGGPGPADNPWTAGALHCGPYPPVEAATQDVWFDTAELTPHVYIAEHEEAVERELGWYALHPVYIWQYLGFVQNFKYELEPEKTGGIYNSLFTTTPMNNRPEIDYATEVLYFEAVCYAKWFGKRLIGERVTYLADILSPALLSLAVPSGLNFWDSGGYQREDDPTAFNLDTARYENFYDLADMELPNETKVIYDQWERSRHTGFSAYRPATCAVQLIEGGIYPYLKTASTVLRQ